MATQESVPLAPDAREVSEEEGLRMLDRAARRYLGMSGKAFIQAWNAGKYRDIDEPNVIAVAMLLPFAAASSD